MQQYIARRGDTVSRIAARHGLTPEHVIQGNPWAGRQPYLVPGQILFLPSAPRKRYAVQPGDDAWSIAALFGVDVNELEKLNPGVGSAYGCTPGKMLVIPPAAPHKVVHLRGEYGPAEVEEDIVRLLDQYPFLQHETIGSSVLGKPLQMNRQVAYFCRVYRNTHPLLDNFGQLPGQHIHLRIFPFHQSIERGGFADCFAPAEPLQHEAQMGHQPGVIQGIARNMIFQMILHQIHQIPNQQRMLLDLGNMPVAECADNMQGDKTNFV